MRVSTLLLSAAAALASIPAYAADSAAFTMPAPSAPGPIAAQRVMVIPFNVLNVPESQQWIGQGVQETIVADLGRSGTLVPVPFEGQVIVEDNATAIRLAKAAGAGYVVRGTAQVVGNNVRITGQLLDVRSGETLQTAMATGTVMDILNLEDSISAQLGGAAGAPPQVASTAAAPVVAPPAAVPAPQIIIVPGGPTYYMPSPVYTPDYAYDTTPFYSPYYPFIYSVTIDRRDRDHDGHDGHDGDGHHGDHHFDPNLGPNGDGSGVFHIITRPSTSGSSALPLATNTVLPLPTNNVLPLPTNNVLPLPTTHQLPLPSAAIPVSVHGSGGSAGGAVSRSNSSGSSSSSGKSH